MARTARINYERITFSFPKKVALILREKVGKNEMSKYVAKLVENDLDSREDPEAFIQSLREFAKRNPNKSGKNSIELLREIRYGEK